MKILMIGAGNPPSTFIQRQIDILRSRNIEVTLFPEFLKHKYLYSFLSKTGMTCHLPSSIISLIKGADIIHYQWPGHLITFGSLARKFEKPAVLSLRGRQINILPFMPGQQKYVRNLKKALPQCAAYHCVSEDIMRVGAQFGLNTANAWINRPAVDTSFFFPLETPKINSPLQIAMVGALIWRKGYEYALLAFRDLVKQGFDVKLRIAGDGPERNRVEYTIRDLGLTSHVQLLGKQTPSDIRKLLWECHIFFHSSLSEGIANVVLEAMASGLPVVAVDSGGLSEVINNGQEGFLVTPRNVQAMSDKLVLLLENESKRLECGVSARNRAIAEFDVTRQGDCFVEMYKAVLNK